MKSIFTLFIAFVAIYQTAFAQNHPTFPSIDEAYNAVKTKHFPNSADDYKKEYGITDLSKIRLEKTWTEFTGNKTASLFFAYSSQYMVELFPFTDPSPLDRCEITFTAITPKNSEGIYYEIPIVVVYQRLKNDVLTNTWELKWIDRLAPTIYGEKTLSSSEKVALALAQSFNLMVTTEDDYSIIKLGNGQEIYADEIQKYYQIDSISFKSEDVISTTSRNWYYTIHGYKYADLGNAKTLQSVNVVYAQTNFEVLVEKINGTWLVQSLTIRASSYGDSKEFGSNQYLGMASEIGFKEVYQQTTKYNPHFEHNFVRETFKSNLARDVKAITGDETKNIASLSPYFNPQKDQNALSKSLLSHLNNLQQKLVDLKEVDVYYTRDDRAYRNYKFTIRIRGSRENCNLPQFKDLKVKYKNAGMSPEEIKRGGEYWGLIYLTYSGIMINNIMYLDEYVADDGNQSDPIAW